MPSQLLPLSSQVEFGEVLGDAAAIQYESAPDRLGWFVCFFSFCMLLLISWSASRPGDWTTTIVVLLFLLPWGWIILRGPDEAFRALVVNWPLLLLPLLTVASTLWSDYPSITLRSGTQYLITICIGIWAGYCIKPRTLLAALLSALALVAVLSVLDGRGQYDALTGEYALVGLFGSKNYFAVCLSFLLLTAIAVTFDRAQAIPFRIIGLGSATLAIPLLIYAHSVGALVISVFASLVFFALHLIVRLPIRSRIAVLSVALVVAAMLVVIAAFDLNYANILESLGKDVTLTGRTLLWRYAFAAISNRPILGGGYQAYWQPGNWSAVQLWFYSYVTDKYGYHFHNTFLEIGVDLGFVGLFVFIATLCAIMLRSIRALSLGHPNSQQLFALTLFLFLLLRMPIEVDLFYQFQIASILLCLIWIYISPQRANRGARFNRRYLVKSNYVIAADRP